jgi:hypothetical protein
MAEPSWSDGNFSAALITGVCIFQNMLNCTLKMFAYFHMQIYPQTNTYLGRYVLVFAICFKMHQKNKMIQWKTEA